jgi:hypothetical protein
MLGKTSLTKAPDKDVMFMLTLTRWRAEQSSGTAAKRHDLAGDQHGADAAVVAVAAHAYRT